MSKFTKYWGQLKPGQKQRTILMLLLIGTIALSLWAYKASRSTLAPPRLEKQKEIALDPKVLEKTMVEESKKATREQNAKLLQITKEIEALKRAQDSGQTLPPLPNRKNIPLPSAKPLKMPPPPGPLSRSQTNKTIITTRETIGRISVSSNPFADSITTEEDGKQKKAPDTIYLPPSFMEATLLTGLDAETVESARGQPEPVLLRIRDLAVLPNRIKTNLKGCFVIAHGYGKLSKERVMLRLVTLSCLAKDGQAVIDQPIKGFVADEDGKNGLRGNVVSRMGASVAYATLAGFAGGAGNAFTTASTTTTTSPLGTTGIIDSKELGKAAIGGGLSGGSHELQRLFLDLARQATPIIEIGATKTVTLIITEGVDLKIKETCIGGSSCEN
ncbi:MAG: TraB/VirB10 family protein [Nitrospiria bacterium]